MDKFEGFTDEDIKNLTLQKTPNYDEKRIQNKTSPSIAVYKQQQTKTTSRYQNRLSRKNVARDRLLKGNILSINNDGLPKEARLHIQKIPEEEEDEIDVKRNSNEVKTNSLLDNKQNNAIKNGNVDTVLENFNSVEIKQNNKDENINFEEGNTRRNASVLNNRKADIIVLEEFETRQKLMEEQNRQRKEILKRALADRAKKTHEEVKRLNEIEGELKKLDVLLSTDVAIIRNQIEASSIDFMEAQKRYDRAEKEFLDAKLDLFNKKEKKELLTSHLCTIIEQNEMRKAKKLSDLMLQLEVGPKSSLITSQIKVEYKSDELSGDKQIQLSNGDEQEVKNNKEEETKIENDPDV